MSLRTALRQTGSLHQRRQLELYKNGEILYISEIPLANRAEYADDAVTQDTYNTHTYFFNTNKAPFDDPDVRLGLSMAIDREAIAEIVTFAKAAEGFVPSGAGIRGEKVISVRLTETCFHMMSNRPRSLQKCKHKSFTILTHDNEVDMRWPNTVLNSGKSLDLM